MLAAHVMGLREDVPQRRAAEHQLARPRGDDVGEIRFSAGDERDLTVAPALVMQAAGQPRADPLRFGALRYSRELVHQAGTRSRAPRVSRLAIAIRCTSSGPSAI